MTPTGNPQNMLIGVSSGIHYAEFVAFLALPAVGGLAIVYAIIALIYRGDLAGKLQTNAGVPVRLADRMLAIKSLLVFAGALVAWLLGGSLPLVAIAAAALLIAISNRDPTPVLARVEWPLLLFFGALFVVMRGVQDLPMFTTLTSAAGARLTGAPLHDATVVSASMVVLSNLVSNVPAVILWVPVAQAAAHSAFVWLVMAMSSTFAGNLTIVGSMANLIVAERAESRGERISFMDYLRVGVPVTIATLAWGVAIASRSPAVGR